MTTQPKHYKSTPGFRIKWAKRKAKCEYCGVEIQIGELMFKGVGWTDHGWHYTICYHYKREDGLMCFMESSYKWAIGHPVDKHPGGPGRKALELDSEQRRLRHNLIAKANRLKKERTQAVGYGWFWKLARLDALLLDIVNQLREVGGIPRSKEWVGWK